MRQHRAATGEAQALQSECVRDQQLQAKRALLSEVVPKPAAKPPDPAPPPGLAEPSRVLLQATQPIRPGLLDDDSDLSELARME